MKLSKSHEWPDFPGLNIIYITMLCNSFLTCPVLLKTVLQRCHCCKKADLRLLKEQNQTLGSTWSVCDLVY